MYVLLHPIYMQPTTRTVSIRHFRENLTKFLKESQEKNVHFVVMRHSEPIAHVTPVHIDKNASLDQLEKDIARARKHVQEGKMYTPEQVRSILGL